MRNAVTLVWGSLRLAPITTLLLRHWPRSGRNEATDFTLNTNSSLHEKRSGEQVSPSTKVSMTVMVCVKLSKRLLALLQ